MKLAIFDENGLPIAFYDDTIHSTIPGEAVGITDAQWTEFIDNQGVKRWNGTDVEDYTPPGMPLDDYKKDSKRRIDNYAGTARQRFITVSFGQEMTYLEKSEEASDYVAAGYPADTSDYPFVQAEIDATGMTKEQAADSILAQKSAWIVAGAAIERHRLAGKAQVEAATDQTGVDVAVATAESNLAAI